MLFIKKNLRFIIIFLTIFLLDRVSKILIINNYELTGNSRVYSSSYLNLDLIWNKGIAFGLLSFPFNYLYNLISLFIFIVILGVIFMFITTRKLEKIFFLVVLSGAIGNFYDRLVFKAVPDFIDLHINNIHWFVFNISDIAITLGVFGLILNELFFKDND